MVDTYTSAELTIVRRMAKEGHSCTKTARAIWRSPGALRQKAMSLGIRFSSLGKKHSRAQKRRWK